MNREIKFRIWNRKENRMCVQGENVFMDMCITNYILCPKNEDEYFNFKYNDYELMEFTGLHDKNGKEIYEGDIFAVVNSHGEIFNVWVEYSKKYAQFVIKCNQNSAIDNEPLGDLREKDLEVMGNIHENKDLLEV